MCILDGALKLEQEYRTYGVNNINGMYYDTGRDRTDTGKFWRSPTRYAPHNAYTNIKKISAVAKSKGYRTTSDATSVLNYTTDEVLLEDGIDATKIKIPYDGSYNVISYKYSEKSREIYKIFKRNKTSIS